MTIFIFATIHQNFYHLIKFLKKKNYNFVEYFWQFIIIFTFQETFQDFINKYFLFSQIYYVLIKIKIKKKNVFLLKILIIVTGYSRSIIHFVCETRNPWPYLIILLIIKLGV